MNRLIIRFSLVVLFAALVLQQASPAVAKKKSSYGTLTDVRFVKNYDGDTITVDLKGHHPLFGDDISVRIAGVDTPEIKGKCAKEKKLAREAKEVVGRILKKAGKINLKNVQRGKYFRIVADVQADKQDVADVLIDKGLAVRYDGGTKGFDWCSGRAKSRKRNGQNNGTDWVDFFDKILK